MPRGSKIGERRGGRDRGTPNRRTVLVDRILAIAAECPTTSAEELINVLLEDQKLPADLRMAIARGTSRSRTVNRSTNKQRRDKSLGPEQSNTAKRASLKMFFSIALNTTVAAEERREAALEATNYLLPKKSGMERWWINAPVDEYGFVITPEIATDYRDIKFELQHLARSESNSPGTRKKIEKLRARMKVILHRLQCPCPSRYGKDQMRADSNRLLYFLQQRQDRTLGPEENAEEAHRRARLDSFDEGPERAAQQSLYALNDKERIARNLGPRLTRRERIELRFLRMLYSQETGNYNPYLDETCYCPLRDEPLAQDDNLYPPNSKLRPPKDDEIEEEFVEIAKYCSPPHARVPPQNEADILYVDDSDFRWSNKLLGWLPGPWPPAAERATTKRLGRQIFEAFARSHWLSALRGLTDYEVTLKIVSACYVVPSYLSHNK
jgi:hypothetical protein